MSDPTEREPASLLDPADWPAFRAEAHRLLDDALDYVQGIRSRPVWQPLPEESRRALREPLSRAGKPLRDVHATFLRHVLPYPTGNVHPRFMGWVHGGGNVFGMVGEMLAAALNANLGGRSHAPVEVERQVVRWWTDLLGWPAEASGLLVTGSSLANFIAVLIARAEALGSEVRREGLGDRRLAAYTSTAAHGCVTRAMDFAGLGTEALRRLPVDDQQRLDLNALRETVRRDAESGRRPFLVIGTAGTVDTGAIDPLRELAAFCREAKVWFHVDGALGAPGLLSAELRPRLIGMAEADSIAFDFHKWGQVPYDAGCILVRDGAAQLRTFASEAAYLRRESRGLAAGAPWPCDLGPDLSRGFRALKVWYTLQVLGADRLGAAIDRTCALARQLAERVDGEPALERVAPVGLNIVCFRYRFSSDADRQNAELAADLQESGVAAPSTTRLGDRLVLRCAIVNHRTGPADVDALVDAVLELGRRRESALPHP